MARTAAIDCCSCLSHERSRRSLRRRALPVPPSAPSRAAMDLPRGFDQQRIHKRQRKPVRTLWWLWFCCVFDVMGVCASHEPSAPNSGGQPTSDPVPVDRHPPAPVLMTGAQKLLCSSSSGGVEHHRAHDDLDKSRQLWMSSSLSSMMKPRRSCDLICCTSP